MPAEVNNGFFINFRTEKRTLPEITWEQMLSNHCYIGPIPLLRFLSAARNYLMNEDGDRKAAREILAPVWFNPWLQYLTSISEDKREIIPNDELKGVLSFSEISSLLGSYESTSGIIFAAGMEGHEGHRRVLSTMSRRVDLTVLGLEEDKYNTEHKSRGGTFLPLEVRISMWILGGFDLVTILPGRDSGLSIDAHYNHLYDVSNAGAYFVNEGDPYYDVKVVRKKDPRILNNILPRYEPGSTSSRTKKLTPEIDWGLIFSGFNYRHWEV